MHAVLDNPAAVHPALWRATQLAVGHMRVVACGDDGLAAQLPGGGWPRGALTELLIQQPGCGELRLLRPALASLGVRPVVFLQAPHRIQPSALAWWGLSAEHVLRLQAPATADALWSAEQVLRAGTAGALLFWQSQVRRETLLRLQLAAQASDMLFVMMRPLAAASDASPAPLRVAVRPIRDGLSVEFVKRRGPPRAEPLAVAVSPSPILNVNRHATVDRRASPVVVPRSVPADVVA